MAQISQIIDQLSIWQLVFVWLVFINLIALIAFGFDKRQARLNNHRISEQKLLLLVALGGSIGALTGQQRFRHKTKKKVFKRQLWTIIAIQTGLLVFAFLALR